MSLLKVYYTTQEAVILQLLSSVERRADNIPSDIPVHDEVETIALGKSKTASENTGALNGGQIIKELIPITKEVPSNGGQIISELIPITEEVPNNNVDVEDAMVIVLPDTEDVVMPDAIPNTPPTTAILCKYCDMPFKTDEQLHYHYTKCKKRWFCHFCHTELPFKKALTHHLYKKHIDVARCQTCQKLFPSEVSLEKHKKEHPNLSCHICDKQFETLNEARTHKYSHTVNSVFWCTLCKNLRHSKENHITFL